MESDSLSVLRKTHLDFRETKEAKICGAEYQRQDSFIKSSKIFRDFSLGLYLSIDQCTLTNNEYLTKNHQKEIGRIIFGVHTGSGAVPPAKTEISPNLCASSGVFKRVLP